MTPAQFFPPLLLSASDFMFFFFNYVAQDSTEIVNMKNLPPQAVFQAVRTAGI